MISMLVISGGITVYRLVTAPESDPTFMILLTIGIALAWLLIAAMAKRMETPEQQKERERKKEEQRKKEARQTALRVETWEAIEQKRREQEAAEAAAARRAEKEAAERRRKEVGPAAALRMEVEPLRRRKEPRIELPKTEEVEQLAKQVIERAKEKQRRSWWGYVQDWTAWVDEELEELKKTHPKTKVDAVEALVERIGMEKTIQMMKEEDED